MERIITSNTVETPSQESSPGINLIWKCTEKKVNHRSDTNSPRAKPASPRALTTKTHLLKVSPTKEKIT
ncbi:hypothetical protein NIES4074_17330 [Cylindrospermum sp. NIES-4074]|nr:hypothetical protein NIES4074_17330 [Cylindrospermum sp. NIES-4074]